MFIQNARNIPKIQPLFSMNWYYFFKARISYLWLLEFCLPILDRFFVWKSLPLVSKGSHHLFEQGIIELVDLVTKIVHCMTEKKIFNMTWKYQTGKIHKWVLEIQKNYLAKNLGNMGRTFDPIDFEFPKLTCGFCLSGIFLSG